MEYKTKEIHHFIYEDVDKTLELVSNYCLKNSEPLIGCIINEQQKSLVLLNENDNFVERIEFEGKNNKWIEKDYKLVNKK